MNVQQVIPLFGVAEMARSVAFYVDGLGFRIANRWEPDGELRWCRLELDAVAVMLQTGPVEARGPTLCFQCDDALAVYRDAKARGLAPKEPFVGNGLWVTSLDDPDGYRLDFSSPTDVPEETTLSELS